MNTRKIRRNDMIYNGQINMTERVCLTGRLNGKNRPGAHFFCTDDAFAVSFPSDFKLLKKSKKERSQRPRQLRRR